METYDKLKSHFLLNAKKGIILNVRDLHRFSKKKGWRVNLEKLDRMRKSWKFIVMHSRYEKPSHFMSNSFPKFGVVMIDYAVFQEKRSRFNEGCKGFLLGVECISQKLSCVPCKDKSRASWKKAVVIMLDLHFPKAHHLISDRDTAVTGKSFLEWLKTNYKTDISFLRSRSKAFLSERMIRFMKERLSLALKFHSRDVKLKDRYNWTRHVNPILEDYNSKFVTGTDIKRSSVNETNYFRVLEDRWKIKDAPTMMSLLTQNSIPKPLSDKIFKYDIGDKVLLSRDANYNLKQSKFTKRSVTGSFGPDPYIIIARKLKNTRNLFLTPVYGLKQLSGLFYETELKYFNDSSSEQED